ncbi:MAG: site-2 protease family protein [Brachymonas sp.]|nr:site-2 protease family protein [Brachymonas sp.]
MNFAQTIQTIAVFAVPVLLAITLHEAAHAYVASRLGDNTAKALGRVTMNPLKHIDPIGTVLMPVLLYVATGGSFVFGYARPVPVQTRQFRQPRRDMALVAVAGPLSNLLQAFAWMALGVVVAGLGLQPQEFLPRVCRAGVLTNVVMFAFNLFPLPPLDGGRILAWLLPQQLASLLRQIEPYGFFIVMALVTMGVISAWWMGPLMHITLTGMAWLLAPLKALFAAM